MQQQDDILVTIANSIPGVDGLIDVVEGIVDAVNEQVAANQLAEMGQQLGEQNAQIMAELSAGMPGMQVPGMGQPEGMDASGMRTGIGGEIDVAVANMTAVGNQQQAEIQAFLDHGSGQQDEIGQVIDQMSAQGAHNTAEIDAWLAGGGVGTPGMSSGFDMDGMDHDGSGGF